MKHFQVKASPVAKSGNIVVFGKARFTWLTSRMIRCEYAPDCVFEDRASQHFWHRDCELVEFKKVESEGVLKLVSNALELTYSGGAFTEDSLKIRLKEGGLSWHFGMEDAGNLRGTLRTLDNCNGGWHMRENKPVELSEGLLSTSGWSVVDDSQSLVFNDEGWLQMRHGRDDKQDLYFFGYGYAFTECLQDYFRVAGQVPMIPRWALGLWWSRWQAYSSEELLQINRDFEAVGLPLSVCVIDMDWHKEGWTGYSWNRELFPDPEGFFKTLHDRDVHACMNLHPAGGVDKHEDAYEAMAKHMGMDPSLGEPVAFDISDPKFVEGYFKYLHHPLEAQGVDFWWMDWQQGTQSKFEHLDPLWYLNHLHASDLARDGQKRPMIFSRWGGAGNHRYPIGFSGDAYITWETLKFETYMTPTSANVGYGWWSHDIGGFSRGIPNDELYVRWVQFGAWSPIFRLHNCGDPTLDYRPYKKPQPYQDAAVAAMQMRRRIMPYLYTAAWRNHTQGILMLRPLYHLHPEEPLAFLCPNQYYFGNDMIVCPQAQPANSETGLSRLVVWLPEGDWYDFHTGEAYAGGRWHVLYQSLAEVAVFVRAGAVIPMYESTHQARMQLHVFPGSAAGCAFYDDDGETLSYQEGDCVHLEFETELDGSHLKLCVTQAKGSVQADIVLRGLDLSEVESVTINGEAVTCQANGDEGVVISAVALDANTQAVFKLQKRSKDTAKVRLEKTRALFDAMAATCHVVRRVADFWDDIAADMTALKRYNVDFTETQMRAAIEVALDCGFDVEVLPDGRERVVCWSYGDTRGCEVDISSRVDDDYEAWRFDPDARDACIVYETNNAFAHWKAHVNYLNLAHFDIRGAKSDYIPQDLRLH